MYEKVIWVSFIRSFSARKPYDRARGRTESMTTSCEHGGDMEYVGVDEDGVVSLELQGACAGCPMSQLTLSMGIERVLKEHVPGVTRVVAVNDNADGGLSSLYDEYAPF